MCIRDRASEVHEAQMLEVQAQHEKEHNALAQQQAALHKQVTKLTEQHAAQQQQAQQQQKAQAQAAQLEEAAHSAADAHVRSPATKEGRRTRAMGGSTSSLTPESAAREGEGPRTPFIDDETLETAGEPARQAIEALGKDNFYYKTTNRELRRRLKDASSLAEAQRQQLDEALQRVAHDEQVNAKLQAELANMRAYLQAHPGATPTRVTKAALKEILPEALTSGGGAARLAWGGGAVDDSQSLLHTPRGEVV